MGGSLCSIGFVAQGKYNEKYKGCVYYEKTAQSSYRFTHLYQLVFLRKEEGTQG